MIKEIIVELLIIIKTLIEKIIKFLTVKKKRKGGVRLIKKRFLGKEIIVIIKNL